MEDMQEALSLLAQINAQITAASAAQAGGRVLSARRALDEIDISIDELLIKFPEAKNPSSLLGKMAAPLISHRQEIILPPSLS
jgi:hypothetical protein